MSGTLKIGSKTLVTHDTSSNKLAFHSDANDTGQLCRAWVNFDGTNAFSPNPSTSAIRDSFNISSILENGAGWYKANFATNMSDTNYAVVGSARPDSNTTSFGGHFLLGRYGNNLAITEVDGVTFTTCKNDQSTYTDSPLICIAIFGS